jgi:SAM-dependent methyltransferase
MDGREIVRRGYDTIARRYDAWSSGTPPTTDRHLSLLRSQVAPGDRVVDLGCGSGRRTLPFRARGLRWIGVDVSASQLELAREIDRDITLVQADIARPLFRPASFAAAVALFSIIHVPRERHATLLAELASWLRPTAPFVMTLGVSDDPGDIEPDWLGAPMYWSGFDAGTNIRLVQAAGFDVESAEIDDVLEDGEPVPFLCVLARRRESAAPTVRGSGASAPRTPPA